MTDKQLSRISALLSAAILAVSICYHKFAEAQISNPPIPVPVPISKGGTGQTTQANALTAILPSQTGNNGKVLGTDGSVPFWMTIASGGITGTYAAQGASFTLAMDTIGKYVPFSVGNQQVTVPADGAWPATVGGTGTGTPAIGSQITVYHNSYSARYSWFILASSGVTVTGPYVDSSNRVITQGNVNCPGTLTKTAANTWNFSYGDCATRYISGAVSTAPNLMSIESGQACLLQNGAASFSFCQNSGQLYIQTSQDGTGGRGTKSEITSYQTGNCATCSAIVDATTNSSGITIGVTTPSFSGSYLTNGVTGESAFISITNARPFSIGSDGANGAYINFDSSGNITLMKTVSFNTGTSTNHTVCWKTGGVLGYCSSIVAADGTCTCN